MWSVFCMLTLQYMGFVLKLSDDLDNDSLLPAPLLKIALFIT